MRSTYPTSGSRGRVRAISVALLIVCMVAPAQGQIRKAGEPPWPGMPTGASREQVLETFPAYAPVLEAALASPHDDHGLSNSALMNQMLESLRQSSSTGGEPPSYVKGDHPEWDEVYAKCAPGVLFLVGENATGTGFVIDRDGFALTNHHVASVGTFNRSERTWSLQAYRGELDDEGRMIYQSEPIQATVYAWDPARDLALLKLETEAFRQKGFEPLKLASSGRGSPRPGQDVALIGHAGIGLLWSMKPGHVSAVGQLSESTPNVLSMLHSLSKSAAGTDPSHLDIVHDHVSEVYGDWIGVDTRLIQSTAVTSPGDSGGPLLDDDGKIVGIAMGLLAHQPTSTTAYYYVHLDELLTFLDDHAETPLLEVAHDVWESGAVRYSLGSLPGSEDGGVLLGTDSENKPTVIALDLDASRESFAYRGEIPLTSPVVGVHALGSGEGYVAAYFDGDVVGLDREFSLVWHQETGQKIFSSDLSGDRRRGLIGSSNGSVVLFDARSAKVEGSWSLDGSGIHAVEFAADAESFWIASAKGMIRRISLSGDVQAETSLSVTPVSLSASPDDGLLAVATRDGAITVFRTSDMTELWKDASARAMQCRFDPSGDALVISPIDDVALLRWLSAESGSALREISFPGSPYFFELSSDGRRVVASIAGGSHVLCDAVSGEVLGAWPTVETPADPRRVIPGEMGPTAIEFSLLEDELLTGGRGGYLYRVAGLGTGAMTTHRTAAEGIDVAHVVRDHAFDAEFAMVLDYELQTVYALYDLDNDGRFELVRLDDDGDGLGDAQFDLGEKQTARRDMAPSEGLLLPPTLLPAAWRGGYMTYLSGQS